MAPLLRLTNLTDVCIEENDAGIILKPNGEIRVFTTGNVDAAALSPQQTQQGERLMAMLAVLTNEGLLEGVMEKIADAEAQGVELVKLGRSH